MPAAKGLLAHVHFAISWRRLLIAFKIVFMNGSADTFADAFCVAAATLALAFLRSVCGELSDWVLIRSNALVVAT